MEQLAAFIVWLVANAVYLDARRSGWRGWRRFFAFWLGLPTTWLSLLLVREGSSPRLTPPPDDDEALLEEIRRARARRLPRAGSDPPTDPGVSHDP